jgi:hypothetical protein
MGLGKSDPEPAPVQQARPKPKPAAPATRVASHGAIKPKTMEKTTDRTADKTTGTAADPTPAARPKPGAIVSQPATTAPPPSRPASTAMNGAAPVVPTGTFDSRWSGAH